MATDELGIDDGWWDNTGEWNEANPDTVATIRDILGRSRDRAEAAPPRWFVRHGSAPSLESPGVVVLEEGAEIVVDVALPHDLPIGYHRLHPADRGPTTELIVSPLSLDGLGTRRWGVTAQLYSCRSTRSWGLGDFGDLARIGRWLASRGGSVIGINPLFDVLPAAPRQASPYSPSTRRHLDPIYSDIGPAPDHFEPSELLDRDATWAAKIAWLTDEYAASEQAQPDEPGSYAMFCTLAEHFGTGWREWPVELHDPDGDAVRGFAARHRERVAFWQYVQDRTDGQLQDVRSALASEGITLMGDLPVGVDSGGFDAWTYADSLARDMFVGAPPDPFSPHGQNWGLPPFDPWALRSIGFAPFVETIRGTLGRFGGLRIDHVMGLFRLFWIPEGAEPVDGAYVRYPADEMLDLLVLEATRAGAFVVGEDLGTVEAGVRETLTARGVAGTKVALFEDEPNNWPGHSLGTLTTHDLPTVEGAVSGSDAAGDPKIADRLLALTGRGPEAAPEDVLVAAHERLARSGSDLVLATMEDLVGSRLRVNLPGTIDSYPNWRIALPVAIDELDEHPVAERITGLLAAERPRINWGS